MNALRVPTIHLNGSSGETLRETYLAAYQALQPSIDALAATAPNQRDYYVQRDADVAWREAVEQHQARQRHLDQVRVELLALIVAIDDDIAARQAQRGGRGIYWSKTGGEQ